MLEIIGQTQEYGRPKGSPKLTESFMKIFSRQNFKLTVSIEHP